MNVLLPEFYSELVQGAGYFHGLVATVRKV